jgi:hypothetical protein
MTDQRTEVLVLTGGSSAAATEVRQADNAPPILSARRTGVGRADKPSANEPVGASRTVRRRRPREQFVYVVTLRPFVQGVPADRRLKRMLKICGRRWGLKCEDLREAIA